MDKADRKRIGNRLRACRKQADLTQEELGEMVGFSKNHISGIERGLNVPTVHFFTSNSQASSCNSGPTLARDEKSGN